MALFRAFAPTLTSADYGMHRELGMMSVTSSMQWSEASVWTPAVAAATTALLVLLAALWERVQREKALRRDLDARAEMEHSLRRSEERLTLIARATHDVVWEWQLEDDRLEWSDALYSTFGYHASEVRADSAWWFEHIHPEDRERVRASLEKAMVNGETYWTADYRFQRGDGSYAPVFDRGFIIRDANGEATGAVGAKADFTQHQVLEEQLRQAQRLESLGRLAGGVAHDFNNLLTVIHGNAALLLERYRPGTMEHEEVSEIQRAGDRASDLTRQLLAFSRKQVLQSRTLNLTLNIRETERMFRRLLGEDINLETDLDPALWNVTADPGQIEQVVLNLVINARDAMRSDGTLTVRTRNVRVREPFSPTGSFVIRPADYVALFVIDDGTGIPPHVLPHIFDPFFTTKPMGVGTGLGLATVYGIVKQSNGYVWAASEPGKGTTMTVYLPCSAAEITDVRTKQVADTSEVASGTILIVEDEAALRDLAARVLRRRGYHVLEAAHGEDALRLINHHRVDVDVVLCDVVMPGMTGTELVKHIRARLPEARVIFMSGYTEDEIIRRGTRISEVAFIEKPFSPAQLQAIIETAMKAKGKEAA
jgi:two-component system, cell cycle sensor histidine kinase and response regulator CckA